MPAGAMSIVSSGSNATRILEYARLVVETHPMAYGGVPPLAPPVNVAD